MRAAEWAAGADLGELLAQATGRADPERKKEAAATTAAAR